MSYNEEIHRHVVDEKEVELRKRIHGLMLENDQAQMARNNALAQLIWELNHHILEKSDYDMGKVVEMRDKTIAELQDRLKNAEFLNEEFRKANAGFEMGLKVAKDEGTEWGGWAYRMLAAYAAVGAGKANALPELWLEGRLIAIKRDSLFAGLSKASAEQLLAELRIEHKPLEVVLRELERRMRAEAAPHLMVNAPDVLHVEADGAMVAVDGAALRCCYIASTNESTVPGALARGCQAIATWSILSQGQTPDLETHTCDRHLPFMLEPGTSSVWPLQVPATALLGGLHQGKLRAFTVDQDIVPIGDAIGWGLQTVDGVTTVFAYTDNTQVTGGDNFWPADMLATAQAEADRLNQAVKYGVQPDSDKAIRFDPVDPDLTGGVKDFHLTEVPIGEVPVEDGVDASGSYDEDE